ncbi:2-C-methyl-D-erythritol 2,4-cyclodiphosphate synthase [Kamptonema cortianum]|nr:2-C-methyl-D-erythritol 2,4-cyclodiphosphate synthase [Geitlerinema splendidum]MDK3155252.1 2-C-methyl-D-erythritol 2,4-cyclodiphosphate synthase [Kamptonema cortianum]
MVDLTNKVCAVLLAAGSSQRFGGDKLDMLLDDAPVWLQSYRALAQSPSIDAVGVVTSSEKVDNYRALATHALFVIAGGDSRQESSRLGVAAVPSDYDIVLVHDAARPFLTEELIQRVVEGVKEHGAAYAALPVTDTVRQRSDDGTWRLLDRETLMAAQTPQGARREIMLASHSAGLAERTDDVELLVACGHDVLPVMGSPKNIKLTFREDIEMFNMKETRTGFGYDVHRFSENHERPLWLGGIEFDERPGLDGHSDADALIHAVVDALLGAAALGDIGVHYPPTDDRWKDCRSTVFLSEAADLLKSKGWHILNIDATIVAERPKVMKRQAEIRSALSVACGIEIGRISIKATTNERLGSIGRAEGIACHAVATICR